MKLSLNGGLLLCVIAVTAIYGFHSANSNDEKLPSVDLSDPHFAQMLL
jgi:hypothetical protein